MRRALPLLLLALVTAACGRTAPATPAAPSRSLPLDVAYIGPPQPARAFKLALRQAGGRGRYHLTAVVMDETCAGHAETHAALAAGSDPAISAAAVADCGSRGAAVALLRRLHLPSVLWGGGLRAVTWSAGATAAGPPAPALAGFVAAYDLHAGLNPIVCQDTAAFCAALSAAGLTVLPAADIKPPPTVHPRAAWTDAAPAQAAALRRALTKAGRTLPLEGTALRSAAYLKAAGAAGAGTLAFAASPPTASPASLARFRALFGQAPSAADQQAFAAGELLAAALRAAGPHRDAIAAHLQTGVQDLPTVAGPVTFDPGGRDVQPPRLTVSIARKQAWVPAAAPATTVSGSVY